MKREDGRINDDAMTHPLEDLLTRPDVSHIIAMSSEFLRATPRVSVSRGHFVPRQLVPSTTDTRGVALMDHYPHDVQGQKPRIGKCMEMCPKEEMARRELENRLHTFEVVKASESTQRNKVDPNKAVKEFVRAAAGRVQPHLRDIRPPSILKKTTHYLINCILCDEDASWLTKYEFILDRLRAIRQDMVMQNNWDFNCVTVLEIATRFHVYAAFRLHAEHPASFDPHYNTTHLQECLSRLLVIYDELDGSFKNRGEMEAIYILIHLGTLDAVRRATTLPTLLRAGSHLKIALDINYAWIKGNFVRVFKLAKSLPFLLACVLLMHIEKIRRHALVVLTSAFAFKGVGYPLSTLVNLLAFNDEHSCKRTCAYYGIKVVESVVIFCKSSLETSKPQFPMSTASFLEEKSSSFDVSQLIAGNA